VTLYLNEHWTLGGAAVFYWRQSLGDGIYDAGGNVVRASDGSSRSPYIGTQADVTLGWEPFAGVSTTLAYSAFVPERFIEDIGPPTVHFVALEAEVRF
jgi:hypothetical protein